MEVTLSPRFSSELRRCTMYLLMVVEMQLCVY